MLNRKIRFLDIYEFFQRNIRYILIFVGVLGVLGIILSFQRPTRYEAYTVFIPQTDGVKGSNSLGGLANIAGISLPSAASKTDIPPTLYPTIISSASFLREILKMNLDCCNLSLEEYLERSYETSLSQRMSLFLNKSGVFSSSTSSDRSLESDFKLISKEESSFFQMMNDILRIDVDEVEGIVKFTVRMSDRYASAEVLAFATKILQDRIIEFKNKRAQEIFNFTEKEFIEKRTEFNQLLDSLSRYQDRNRNMATAYSQNDLRRLESEFRIAESVYSDLANQRAQARMNLNRDTPVFSSLVDIDVTVYPVGMRKRYYVLCWIVIGLVLAIIFFLIKEQIEREMSNKVKN